MSCKCINSESDGNTGTQRIHQAEGSQTAFNTKKALLLLERVYMVGNTLQSLPIDSPDSGDELKKKSHRRKKIVMEKNDFENFDFEKKSKMLIFSSKIQYEFYL